MDCCKILEINEQKINNTKDKNNLDTMRSKYLVKKNI